MTERWLPVVGWEGVYEVSDLGRVKRVLRANGTRPGVLKGGLDRYGYPVVALTRQGRYRYIKVHRLVGDAFLGPLPVGLETRHLNGDPADARLVNLAYGTHAENMQDMVRHGRSLRDTRTHCPQGHEYSEANVWIDNRNARNCRICLTARALVASRRKRAEDRAKGLDFCFEIRRWGRANGFAVKERGRISNELLNAFRAANPAWSDAIETRVLRAA